MGKQRKLNNITAILTIADNVFKISLIFFIINLMSCYPTLDKEAKTPEESLIPIKFFYPEFHDDMDVNSLAAAIEKSLEYLDKLDQESAFFYGSDSFSCREVKDSHKAFLDLILRTPDPKELRKEIKAKFRLYRAAGRPGNNQVLFTGYFEPIFNASLNPDKTFKYPIYSMPADLIKIDLSLFEQ